MSIFFKYSLYFCACVRVRARVLMSPRVDVIGMISQRFMKCYINFVPVEAMLCVYISKNQQQTYQYDRHLTGSRGVNAVLGGGVGGGACLIQISVGIPAVK
jgi:hypothetical protein